MNEQCTEGAHANVAVVDGQCDPCALHTHTHTPYRLLVVHTIDMGIYYMFAQVVGALTTT